MSFMNDKGARVVLGVDAAWTAHNPSGVALVVETAGRWRLVELAPSYLAFEALAGFEPEGSTPDPKRLLAAARAMAGRAVDLVAIDMPLAHSPIVGRRPSDLGISKAYGAKWAATHSPGKDRPGKISDGMRAGFAAVDYPLATEAVTGRALIEVYPHPALIEFMGAERRLEYKAGKTLTYWPNLGPQERRANLLAIWRKILGALEMQIIGVQAKLPLPESNIVGAAMKAFEDQLDAVVCAAIGIAVLNGEARAYGDADSAIWVPTIKIVDFAGLPQ
jgi:predicted RNase H-like nuclease